jgi:hypothetical protein
VVDQPVAVVVERVRALLQRRLGARGAQRERSGGEQSEDDEEQREVLMLADREPDLPPRPALTRGWTAPPADAPKRNAAGSATPHIGLLL